MPEIFKHGNTELENLIQSPSLENLIAYFDARTAEWCEPAISMECFTVGVFYDLAQSFKGCAAFNLLDIAASMQTEHTPDKKYMRYIDLLASLAESSGTTEVPPSLQQNWKIVFHRAKVVDQASVGLESLRRHYRDLG